MKIGIAAVALGGAALVVLALSQHAALRELRSEVAVLKSQVGDSAEAVESAPRPDATPAAARSDLRLGTRVLELEQRVEELRRTSDFLMEHGQAPLTPAKAEAMIQSLFEPATSDRDRVTAARLLLRNGMFTDAAAAQVAALLPGMTDSRLKRELLETLQGATNAVLKTPLLQLAASDPDHNIRERAVQRLGRFADDPQVEQQLWAALRDAGPDVRRNAEEVLRRLPPSDTRLAQARQRGLGADSSLEEKFLALQMLQNGKQDLPELATALAQAAADNQNPDLRLRVLQGFDHVSHPSFVAPLVQSLQDPDPRIRQRAADALSGFRENPAVNEWLQHVAQADADPAVRHEATDALGNRRHGR